MAGWFDDFARKSARGSATAAAADAVGSSGMTRRDVLVRGSLVAGVAWTAPMLMSTRAYAAGVSTCASTHICYPNTANAFCCPSSLTGRNAFQCYATSGGSVGCAGPGAAGGFCPNSGAGTGGCDTGLFCNGNASSNDCRCTQPDTCGGYGSKCTVGNSATQCSPGYVCIGSGFCTPECSATTPCPSGLINSAVSNLTCVGSFCRQNCSSTAECPANTTCNAGLCV